MWQFGALLSQNLKPELAEACRVIKMNLSEIENPFHSIIKMFQTDLLTSFSAKMQIIDKMLSAESPAD
jgi:hypothetical protein